MGAAGGLDGAAEELGTEDEADGGAGAVAGDQAGKDGKSSRFGADVGVLGVVVEADFVGDGVTGFAGFGAEHGEEAGAVVEAVGGCADPVFAEFEAGDAEHASVVGLAVTGDPEREAGPVGDHLDAGDADAVFVEDGAGEGAHAVEAEFGEEGRVAGHGDGRAVAGGATLAVGGGEEAFALGLEEVEAIGDADELELAGAAGARLLLFGVGAGDGREGDDGAGERFAGGPVENDAADDAGGEGLREEREQAEDSHVLDDGKCHGNVERNLPVSCRLVVSL